MDIEALLDKPLNAQLPPGRKRADPPHTGGSCRCLCHADSTRRMVAAGLFLFGGFAYLLGLVAGIKTPKQTVPR